MGHSLGSQVILSTVERLAKKNQNTGIIESAHFFGASITSDVPSSKKFGALLDKIIRRKNCKLLQSILMMFCFGQIKQILLQVH